MLWSCDTGKSFQTPNSLSKRKGSFYLPQQFDWAISQELDIILVFDLQANTGI